MGAIGAKLKQEQIRKRHKNKQNGDKSRALKLAQRRVRARIELASRARAHVPAGVVPLVLADEVPHVPAPVVVVHAQVHVGPGLHLPAPVLDGGERHDDEKGALLAL